MVQTVLQPAQKEGEIPQRPPPAKDSDLLQWLRNNLFGSITDTILSLVCIACAVMAAKYLINWSLIEAVWTGSDRQFCTTTHQGGIQHADWSGACWAFIRANFLQIIYGRYPISQLWRVNVTAIVAIIVNAALLNPRVGLKAPNFLMAMLVVPAIGYVLLCGGYFGLPVVDTQLWGGLMVTIVISYASIALSLPLGLLLALGRRSDYFAIKWSSIAFIEILRGVPLITVLFIASILFPLFLPEGVSFDKLLRAMIGVALFTSVYVAEVIRGGLQAIAKSQYEAAASLGFGYWGTMLLIVMPQALRIAIPGIVTTLIGMLKDTSLIYVISMFDVLGIIQQLTLQASWITPQTPKTGYLFAGLVFWLLCFAMSRYSSFIEKRLNRDKSDGGI